MPDESQKLPSKPPNPATALVTGASRGIGRAVALALAARGLKLVITARSREDLDATARQIGSDCEVVVADLAARNDVEGLAAAARRQNVSILANVAGVWHDDQRRFYGRTFEQTPWLEVQHVLGVGLLGSMLLTQLLLPQIRLGRGRIAFMGCGFAGPQEARGWVHYYATNQAITALVKALSEELRPAKIPVNCVAPWFVASEAAHRFFPGQMATALAPTSVAEVVSWLLCDDSAAHISGQTIEVRSAEDTGVDLAF